MEESFKDKLMKKVTAWLDPKLAKYRIPEKKQPYVPKTEKEFIGVLKRTPEEILSNDQRNLIAGVMTFDQIPVSLIMTERKDMMFLSEADFLGPLLLDKMYKTGASHFPVLDKEGQVCGIVHTDDIDPLTITEDQPVDQFIDKKVSFARGDYSLKMLLAAIIRTNSDYIIVVDRDAHVIGSVTLDMLMAMLFGRRVKDSFTSDDSPFSVARRTEK
jgi:CBS domain containing-hemolysin-like protein